MRVWFVNHYAIPPSMAGGTRHYALAKELIQRGHEVVILASSFDHTLRKEAHLAPGQLAKLEDVSGVPFLWLRTPAYGGNGLARLLNMFMFAFRVWSRAGTKQLLPPDVIYGSSPHLFGAMAAERLAAYYKVPFVLEVRDLWPQSLVDLGDFSSGHPAIRAFEQIERYLYRKATRICSLLPGAVEHMAQKGAERSKVVWLPNGVDLGLVPEPTPPRENDLFTVMYAGTHGLANGLDTVLDAAGILQRDGWGHRVRVRLVGDGPRKPGLQERVVQECLDNVSLEPPVPKGEIYRVMQEADAFIMCLKHSPVFRWGVSPNKMFDYMASGRPVIFGVDAMNNPIADASAGITIQPENAHAMAEAIKQLAGTPLVDRASMGERARVYVETNHAFSRLGDKLDAVLCAAVKG